MTPTRNPLCPDCGHHIHHPGSCQWTFGPSEWPCVCVPGQPGCDPRDTETLTVADDPTEPPPLRWGCFFMALGAWLAWATFVGVVWAVTR